MNLFKKTTATIALVTLLSGVFSAGVSANSTSEIEAANALAADGYINNHSDDAAAYNLNQNVLRQEIAAVARGIAGLDKKSTCDNSFDDVTATTPNTWACYSVEALSDAGLIAANANFHPEANISKAEAVGMMVKAAFGSEYAYDATKSDSWQEQVVDFAVSKGVVASFTNYNTPATRGFVFEAGNNAMVASTEVANTCDEVSQLLGLCGDTTNTDTTTTDTTTTDTTTTDTTTTDTTPAVSNVALDVTTNPTSLADGSQIPNVGTVRFAKVDFTAGSEDVAVNTVKVSKLTLASIKSGTRIWFEKNGRRISGKAAFSSDNTAVISFAPALNVMAGGTETVDLYVELPATNGYAAGNDLQFKGEVTDASVSTDSTFTTPLLTTASYAVAPAVFKYTGTTSSYNDLSNPVDLAKFTIKNGDTSNETRDETFQSVTLRQLGNGSLDNLSNITIVRNGEVVAKDPVVDGKYVTFEVNDTIKDSTTATYYVKAMVDTVDNNDGDTYKFELKKDTDLNVIESVNGFRSTIITSGTIALYTVLGSDITFARDSATELSDNVAIGTNNVTLLKGTIDSIDSVTLEDPSIGFTIDGSPTATGANDLFNNVYLKIGSTVMTWTPTSTETGSTFLGLATLPAGSTDVEIYADVKDTASAKTFKFDDLNLGVFATKEYTSNQNTVSSSVGSISGISVSIDSTALSINKVDGLGNTTLAQGTKDSVLNSVSLSVTQGNDVIVSNATYDVTYSGSASNNVFLTLFANGDAVQTKTFSGSDTTSGTVSFDTLNATVTDTTPVVLTVKADFSDAYSAGDFSIALKSNGLDATDVLTSAAVTLPSVPTSANFTVAQAVGTLAASDSNPHAKLLLAGSTSEQLLAFRVRATNDDIKLRDLTFTGSNLGSLSNYKITDVNGSVVADSATTTTSTGVTFKNLNISDVISKDSTKTYYVTADTNLNTSATGVVINLDQSGSQIKSSNGTIIAMAGDASVSSNSFRIEENMAVIAKNSNDSKDLATSALRFSVTATGNNAATLTGITVKPSISGYTGTTEIAIYKDSVSASNLVGTGTYNNNTVTVITASNFNTIDSGNTNNYIIAFTNAVVDSTAYSSDWSVNVTDVTVDLDGNSSNGTTGNVNVSSYDNMGTLPLTETK